MPVLYPDGYATRLVTLGQLESLHGLRMHPEYRRRLFRWIESMGGHIGIGGGWRATGTQPDRPGFAAEGKSFHQSQTFRSGLVAYAAVDLVARTGGVHRAPTWGESETAPAYGLHTFITGEPWHMQCIEMRGWQTWVNAGRPDPKRIAIPGDEPPTDPGDDVEALPPTRLFEQHVQPGVKVLVPCPVSGTVFVNVTIDSPDGPGWVYSGDSSGSSIVNAQPGVANSCCVPVGSLGGFYLTSTVRARLIVDLFGKAS